jgi:hypothetical protein
MLGQYGTIYLRDRTQGEWTNRMMDTLYAQRQQWGPIGSEGYCGSGAAIGTGKRSSPPAVPGP